jgi:D-beta-D-heptose 7-phosphate kinase/D-beta-D-heptose 1-phosphate adenosyltransferase
MLQTEQGFMPPSLKTVNDYERLAKVADGLRAVNRRIVLTIGSWDLLHIGHVRYLLQAKARGDILIVGVDTDRAIKFYKGPLRPIVPENERSEMLSYQACVDFITLLDDVDEQGKWQYDLLRKIKPDVFVAVEDSYPQSQLDDIRQHCGELVVLPRQAENTSTTRMIQNTVKKHLDQMYALVDQRPSQS